MDDGDMRYPAGRRSAGEKKNARARWNANIIMGLGAMVILAISRQLKLGIV